MTRLLVLHENCHGRLDCPHGFPDIVSDIARWVGKGMVFSQNNLVYLTTPIITTTINIYEAPVYNVDSIY